MARSVTCDGCGQPLDGAFEQVGIVLKGDYCDECAEIATELCAAVDQLHDTVREDFRTGMNSILEDFEKANPGFMVPDYRHRS